MISKLNKGFFLLFVIDVYSKEAWVISLKDKKGITITNAFQNILDDQTANQIKYGWIKTVNFAMDQWNHFWQIMI